MSVAVAPGVGAWMCCTSAPSTPGAMTPGATTPVWAALRGIGVVVSIENLGEFAAALSLLMLVNDNKHQPQGFFVAMDRLSGKLCCYASTIMMAPAVMSRPPTTAAALSFSPNSSQASNMTRGTLNLSSGATRDAGPSCRARK